MQITAIRQVECPVCTSRTTVSIRRDDVEAISNPSVAAFGEQTKVTCSNGHIYWVQLSNGSH
ncbi:hypothetical protein [Natronorubrum tibetense]